MSEFATAGYDNTPDIYLTNKEVGKFSELDDAALQYKRQLYGNVLMQHGLNPRAFVDVERILAHLTFELQYRAGAYDAAIAEYRDQEAAEGGDALVSEEIPATLALRRQE